MDDTRNPRETERKDRAGSRSAVVPLDELDDFKVADGDPDVRGWEVRTSDGHKFGRVHELLADPAARKVRYLEVKLDDSDQTAIVPVGEARLLEDSDVVIVDRVGRSRLGELPQYDRGRMNRAYETTMLLFWKPESDWKARQDRDFYHGDTFDERRFYGSRRTATD